MRYRSRNLFQGGYSFSMWTIARTTFAVISFERERLKKPSEAVVYALSVYGF